MIGTKAEARDLIKKLRRCSLEKFTLNDIDAIRDIESRLENGRFAVSSGVIEISATHPDRRFLRELLSRVSTPAK